MVVLFYKWNILSEDDVCMTLKNMGFEVVEYARELKSPDYDMDCLDDLRTLLGERTYDFVFTMNFVPLISRVCNIFKIPYISWVVDSPEITLYSKALAFPCNYVFIFDRKMAQKFAEYNPGHIFYMPLGTNIETWDQIEITDQDKKLYTEDVVFIGSLYNEKTKYDSFEIEKILPEYLKGYVKGVLDAQLQVYGYNLLEDVITDEIAAEFKKYADWVPLQEDYNEVVKDIVVDEFLGIKCTQMERIHLLNAISEQAKVSLYTKSDTTAVPKVCVKGIARYEDEMPKIFRCSKININISLKSIQTGLPLRILDILGNQGFLISNYQSEMEDFFEIGKDLVIYEDEKDLVEKINYYLEHEEERKEIARNGYEKVRKYFTWENRLSDIFKIMEEILQKDISHSIAQGKKSEHEDKKKQEKELECNIDEALKQKDYEKACDLIQNIYFQESGLFNLELLNTNLAVIYIYLQAFLLESDRHESELFHSYRGIEQLVHQYFHLKFLMRRNEFDLDECYQEELAEYVRTEKIPYELIHMISEYSIINKKEFYNRAAYTFYKAKMYDKSVMLLFDENKIDPSDSRVLYNLYLTLYEAGEKELAKQYLFQYRQLNSDEEEAVNGFKLLNRNQQAEEMKAMNTSSKKFCFIICTNNEAYFSECKLYISQLYIPHGCEIEILAITDATGITEAYNRAMKQSNADYKIYMHQDVMLVNRYMLFDILQIFSLDSKIGLIGVAGTTRMPENGVWWEDDEKDDYRELYQDVILGAESSRINEVKEDFIEVEAVDGVLMVTSKDIPWRSDIFTGWHHYDVSQSMEFRRKGYKVVIPKQSAFWCLHDQECNKDLGTAYGKSRRIFVEEYKKELERKAR